MHRLLISAVMVSEDVFLLRQVEEMIFCVLDDVCLKVNWVHLKITSFRVGKQLLRVLFIVLFGSR